MRARRGAARPAAALEQYLGQCKRLTGLQDTLQVLIGQAEFDDWTRHLAAFGHRVDPDRPVAARENVNGQPVIGVKRAQHQVRGCVLRRASPGVPQRQPLN